MRGAVRAIYHFADRLASLALYRAALDDAAAGRVADGLWAPVFAPLTRALLAHRLPLSLLHDLLDAFVQDTGNPIYADRTELLDYCRRSANPIGRLMLHLAGVHDETSLTQSDAICTALQLINFWQDASIDLARGRHYVPETDLAQHGLNRSDLRAGADRPATQALLRELCQWAAELMRQGAPLACSVPGRLGWELRGVVQGGLRILERIEGMHYRTLSHRPALGALDLPLMSWRAWRMRADRPTPGFVL
jgi:squalene synthase HpnC